MAAAYLDPNLNHTAGSGAKSRLSMERSPGAMERVLKVFHYFESNNEPSTWVMNIRHGDATDVRNKVVDSETRFLNVPGNHDGMRCELVVMDWEMLLKGKTVNRFLRIGNGGISNGIKEMTEKLNSYLASVFTKEDTNNVPEMMENTGFSEKEQLEQIYMSREMVLEKLKGFK
eukprot:g41520.t1